MSIKFATIAAWKRLGPMSVVLGLTACAAFETYESKRAKRDDALFQSAVADDKREAFAAYLKFFPDGAHTEAARKRLAELDAIRMKDAPRRAEEQRRRIDAYLPKETTLEAFRADDWPMLSSSSVPGDVVLVIEDRCPTSTRGGVCIHGYDSKGGFELSLHDGAPIGVKDTSSKGACSWMAWMQDRDDIGYCYVLIDAELLTFGDVLLFSGGDHPVLLEKHRIPFTASSSSKPRS